MQHFKSRTISQKDLMAAFKPIDLAQTDNHEKIRCPISCSKDKKNKTEQTDLRPPVNMGPPESQVTDSVTTQAPCCNISDSARVSKFSPQLLFQIDRSCRGKDG